MTDPQAQLRQLQLDVCAKYRVAPVNVSQNEKLGIAENVKSGEMPINGMRIEPGSDSCGWYIWAGREMSQAPDFFVPLHVAHLETWCQTALPFLLLPPGWRFLIADGHVDVWFDPALASKG